MIEKQKRGGSHRAHRRPFPKLAFIDISPEGMPKRSGMCMDLLRKIDVYTQTSFYVRAFIGSFNQIERFKREVMGEILERIRHEMADADADFIATMDPTDSEHVRRLRQITGRYEDELNASRKPTGMGSIEINGIPMTIEEGFDVGPGTVTNVSKQFLTIEWEDNDGFDGLAVVALGETQLVKGHTIKFTRSGDTEVNDVSYPS